MTVALTACFGLAAAAMAASNPLGVDDCVRLAIGGSAEIERADARVRQWQARLAEVEALYWPKLKGIAYISPMYTVRGDISHYETQWRSIDDWGPYTHLEAVLALPLYSFGRVEAGKRAATQRAAVERARARQVRNSVALEVKRLYYLRLYALGMLPALRQAKGNVQDAITYAEEAFAEGTGEATQTDVAKLHYADSEVAKNLALAESGVRLATYALKHTMGLSADEPLVFKDEMMPELPDAMDIELAPALVAAAKGRPEWAEIEHGKEAALALAQAEKLANAPALFLAGMVKADWTPMRDPARNPYANDPYNRVIGGVGLGIDFNIDPAASSAKADGAQANHDEIVALERFAKTGIPLQVRTAHENLTAERQMAAVARSGLTATKRWLTFSSAAYTTGTGDAREVFEGLVAYLQARKGYLESLRGYFVARAELDYAMGSMP